MQWNYSTERLFISSIMLLCFPFCDSFLLQISFKCEITFIFEEKNMNAFGNSYNRKNITTVTQNLVFRLNFLPCFILLTNFKTFPSLQTCIETLIQKKLVCIVEEIISKYLIFYCCLLCVCLFFTNPYQCH